ncbi:TPA: nitric oxide synthase [Neisseria meningitidis]
MEFDAMPSETFRLQTAWAWKDKAGTKNRSVLPLLAVPSVWFAVLPPYFQNMTQVFHVFFYFSR